MQTSNFNKLGQAFLCTTTLLCFPLSASAEWVGNAAVEIRHDSNINNAQLDSDIASVSSLNANAAATGFFPLEDGNSLSVTGEARGEAFSSYNGLNNVSLGATLAFRKKWALGPYALWSGLSISSAHLNYANNIRNGQRNQLAIRGGKRVHERWNVFAEYMAERRSANTLPPDQPDISGDVFTQSSRAMTLNAEYIWNDNIFVTFGALLRRGDVIASVQEPTNYSYAQHAIVHASKAIATDTVYGPHFYAYRMDGTTYGLNVDINFALTPDTLLRAALSRNITHTEGGNNYAKGVQMVTWSRNF